MTAPSSSDISIVAVGDLAFNGQYHRKSFSNIVPWRALTARWQSFDLRTGNLESPFTTANRYSPNKLTLRGSPYGLQALRDSRFDVLTVANNHSMDFSPVGLFESTQAVAETGINLVGAGQTAKEARRPLELVVGGKTIAVFAFCDVVQISPLYADSQRPGVAALDDAAIQSVKDMKRQVDWIVVHVHWGVEMCQLPSPEQRATARRLVEAGADLIIGHHPHVVQPMEKIEEAQVWYSLGNFLFSSCYWKGVDEAGHRFQGVYSLHRLSRRGGWAEIYLGRQRRHSRFHPTVIKRNGMVAEDDGPAANKVWSELCSSLHADDYELKWELEKQKASERRKWISRYRTLNRQVQLRLFKAGLIGRDWRHQA